MANQTELGRAAYEAYALKRNWTTYDDRPMPQWEDVGEGVQNGWIAAAQAVQSQPRLSRQQYDQMIAELIEIVALREHQRNEDTLQRLIAAKQAALDAYDQIRGDFPPEESPAPLALDGREQLQVRHALFYSNEFAGAGAPGHGQFILIAKLARALGL